MELKYVSKQVAIALKGAGFDWKCESFYSEGEDEIKFDANENWNDPKWLDVSLSDLPHISAPTQELARLFLRKKFNLELRSEPNASGWQWIIETADGTFVAFSNHNGPNDAGTWDEYEDALEVGLDYSLNLSRVKSAPEKKCKGSMVLGTGCGKCSKCKSEIKALTA